DVDAPAVSRQIAETYLGMTEPQSNTTQERASRRALSSDLAGKWESRQGFILSTKIDGAHLIASTAGESHVMSLDANHNQCVALSDGFRLLLQRRGRDSLKLHWEGDR